MVLGRSDYVPRLTQRTLRGCEPMIADWRWRRYAGLLLVAALPKRRFGDHSREVPVTPPID